jgi:uncharacterized protein
MLARAHMVLFSALFLASCSSVPPAPVTHVGFYGGGYGVPPDYNYTQIEFTKGADGVMKGELWRPYALVGSFPLSHIRIDGARVRFRATPEGEPLTFDLVRTDIGYRGSITVRGRRHAASFAIRPGSAPPETAAQYEGTYDLGGGRLLTLSRNNATGSMWYVDLPSGRTGFLFNLSNYEFIAGRCFYCVEPIQLRIAFDKNASAVTGLWLTEGRRKRFVSRAQLIREERLTFTSADGTKLGGTLYLPLGSGPHPALVMVHGSGAQTRNGYYGSIRFLSEAHARRGIAVLAYDKRGTGESKGDWERADLGTLAEDAVAAIRTLQTRADIDEQRLGLSGASQAATIIPLASAQVPEVKLWQIISGGPALGVQEQERLRLVLQMRAEGYPESEIERASRIRLMMDDYAKTGQGWDELAAAFKEVEKEFWAVQFLGGLPAPDAPDWPWLRKAFQYDFVPYLERYGGSARFLFAQYDTPTPVAWEVPRLEAALKNSPSRDWSILIIPGATHNHYIGRNGGDREFPGLSRYVPRHFEYVPEWVAERFGLPKGSATSTPPQ